MSREHVRRRSARAPAGAPGERTVRRQLAWAAGADSFQNRDPLYHVTESFQQTFDAIGRRHAARLAGAGGETAGEGRPGEQAQPETDSARAFYERASPEDQELLRRFSETAFQRGTLSGAVLQGSGTMMLFSCLKRTAGQSQPGMWQQRRLFEGASIQRDMPGCGSGRVQVNQGFAHSAVALTVDVLRNARQVVDSLQDIAMGRGPTGPDGAQTLQKLYPFLDDGRERGLLARYRGQLEDLPEGDPRRAVLQNAAARAQALIGKKTQMKQEFMNKLRFLSERAGEALESFEQPGFSDALDRALRRSLDGAEEPGEDGGEDGQAEGGADGAAPADEPGGEPDPTEP